MNKTAIKSFAIWARNKLIAEITYKAGLMGITETGIKDALPQSGNGTEYYDIGVREPYAISGLEVRQRKELAEAIAAKESESDYPSAYRQVMDEAAYTWFNRLIAVRFMEVNDYLPSRIRVLSSESGKLEPDIVTSPFDAQTDYTDAERVEIIAWKNEEKLDEVFRYLFLKQCNELSAVLPALFEKVSDYTELLLAVSFTDKEGVVYHLVHDIPEKDFRVEIGGQVEIIGWLYQYYNTEPKAKVFARASGTKIRKEEIPAATQLFTPHWIVRYMVENSLGRLWLEGHPDIRTQLLPTKEEQDAYVGGKRNPDDHKWYYYLEEAEQEPDVQVQLDEIRREYAALNPEDLLCMDPCMGSGHILCYFFDVLMQIYEGQGYTRRDAAQNILEYNIWGLDIDDRAYQLAYFAVMMKARQYDRRILSRGIQPHVYAIAESNGFNKIQLKYFGTGLDETVRTHALEQVNCLLERLFDAKEYGSILSVENMDWELLRKFAEDMSLPGQMEMDAIGIEKTQERLKKLIDVGEALAQKYHVTCTNPPYMGASNMNLKLVNYIKNNYSDYKSDFFSTFVIRCSQMTRTIGKLGFFTPYVWMFIQSYEKMRIYLYERTIEALIQFEYSAFEEATVPVCTFAFTNNSISKIGCYLRLTKFRGGMEVQRKKALEAIANHDCGYYYEQIPVNFAKIPGKPVAYWASKNVVSDFEKMKSIGDLFTLLAGTSTGDNTKYQRLWYEVDYQGISRNAPENMTKRWYPCNTGGNFRKYTLSEFCIIDWENDGYRIKNHINSKGRIGSAVRNRSFFFHEGITWNKLSSSNFGVRYIPAGYISDDTARMIVSENREWIFSLLGFLCSKVCKHFLTILSPTLSFTNSELQRLPLCKIEEIKMTIPIVEHNIYLSLLESKSFETSWDFEEHPLITYKPRREQEDISIEKRQYKIEDAFEAWEEDIQTKYNILKSNEEELNRIFINIYGLQDELTPKVEDKDVTVRKADLQRDIKSLISYAVGCMFGRYSLNVPGLIYAGGEWDDSQYSTFIPDKDNVLPITDEEYFEGDIVGLFCTWLKKVYGENTLEENLDFIAKALGNKGNSSREIIRNYFLNNFFKDHCSTYSVTGSGKRPIYWLYDSGKQNGFKALVYMHRYNADTTGRVRADYLHHIEKIYGSEIDRMEDTIQNSKNNREVAIAAKRREKLQKQLKECCEYDEKIAHLALARIEIDLDDGVKANYRKVQTDASGKFYEILADSKAIMAKER